MRGAALLISAVVAVPLLLALALPTDLFGSAPTDRQWHADAADIRIVDGETLAMGEQVVRLAGMAAPMRGEICRHQNGETFDCGGASAAALMRLVTSHPVNCRITGRDAFGRGIGQCEAGGTDLGRTLVSSGYAIATGSTMRSVEAAARQHGTGLWANRSGTPQDWRDRE